MHAREFILHFYQYSDVSLRNTRLIGNTSATVVFTLLVVSFDVWLAESGSVARVAIPLRHTLSII